MVSKSGNVETVIHNVVAIHETRGHVPGARGRAAGAPPRQYVALLETYNNLYQEKQSSEHTRLSHLTVRFHIYNHRQCAHQTCM